MKQLTVPQKYIGIDFQYNGRDFSGVDCLGLAKLFVQNELGIAVKQMPDDTIAVQNKHEKYISLLNKIPIAELQPGDVAFFSFHGRWHCGVYVGYRKILHITRPFSSHQRVASVITPIPYAWNCHYIGSISTKGKKEIIVPEASEIGTIITIISVVMSIFSVVSAITAPKPKLDFGNDTGSPTYGFDALSNTISNELIYPIIFGKNKVAGNIIWYKNEGDITKRFIVIGIGQINSISDVRVNDIAIADLPGCSYTAYLGTPDQTVDSRAGGEVKGLRRVAYVALTLQTSEKLTGGNPTVTYQAEGLLMKTWNGSTWSGAAYSKNPAAAIRHLLILPRYQGGAGADEADIDDASFGEVYDYHAAQVDDGEGGTHARSEIDLVIDARKPFNDVLRNILSAYRMYLLQGEKIKLKVEKQDNIVQAFTMDNINVGSFKYYYASKNEKYNKVIVQYTDPNQNDVKVEARAEDKIDQDETGEIREGEFSFLCISRFAEASRRAQFILNDKIINGIFCEFDANIDALNCEVGDVLSVSHDVPAWNAKPFRVVRITEESNHTRHVIAREYNASIYDDSFGSVIEDYDYGSPPNPYDAIEDVSNLQIEEVLYQDDDGTYLSDIKVTFTAPTSDNLIFLNYYLIQLKQGAGSFITVGTTADTEFRIPSVKQSETYYVKVKTVSVNDVISDGVVSASLFVEGKTGAPPNVVNFAVTFTNELEFRWDKETIADFAGTEIRLEDANWGVQNPNLVYRGKVNTYTIVNPGSRSPGTYYARHYDTSGNYSASSVSVTPTNPAPAAPSIAATQWFGFAKIEWSDVADQDLKYYEVYKSPTNAWGGEESLEAKVSGTAATVQGNAPVDAKADAADATSITDADIAGYGTDYFVGDVIVQTSGAYEGQEAIVTAYNNSTGKVSVASWPSGTPDIDDEFVIKDRAYYKVCGVDTYGAGNLSLAVTIDFTPLAEAEIGDAVISARKLIAGELITLSAQIKDAVITSAKILDLDGSKITADSITADKYNELRNTYVYTADDSLDASYPFEVPFKIVSEMTSIVSIKLSFKIYQFRAYATGIPSGGGTTSGATGSASGGGTTSGANSKVHAHTVTFLSGSGNTCYFKNNVINNSAGGSVATSTDEGHSHTIDMGTDTSGGNLCHVETGRFGIAYFGGRIKTSTVNGHFHYFDAVAVQSAGSGTLYYSGGAFYTAAGETGTQTSDQVTPDHTHSNPDHVHPPHQHTNPNHVHALSHGIFEDSTSPTVHFHIDNGAGYGGASADYTTDQIDLVITGSISGVGWKKIRFDANTRCRIFAIIECKLDISA